MRSGAGLSPVTRCARWWVPPVASLGVSAVGLPRWASLGAKVAAGTSSWPWASFLSGPPLSSSYPQPLTPQPSACQTGRRACRVTFIRFSTRLHGTQKGNENSDESVYAVMLGRAEGPGWCLLGLCTTRFLPNRPVELQLPARPTWNNNNKKHWFGKTCTSRQGFTLGLSLDIASKVINWLHP